MKTLMKLVAGVVILGILGIIGATVALRMYWPPEKVKAFALEQLSSRLKREVNIGSVSLGLWSGLELSDLKISEAPTFAKGTFISSERLSVKLAWLPLLKREIVVRQIALKRPEIQIIRLADGKTFNFSDLASAPTKTAALPAPSSRFSLVATAYAAEPVPAVSPSAPPFSQFLIANALIQEGLIHFVDQSPAKQSLDITAVSLKLKNVSLSQPFSALASLHVQIKGADVAFALDSLVDAGQGALNIKQASLSLKKSQVLLSGEVSRLKTSDPLANLKIEIPSFLVSDLAPIVVLPKTVTIDKPIKGTVTLKGDTQKMDVVSDLALGLLQMKAQAQVFKVTAPAPSFIAHVETNAFPIDELLNLAPGSVPQDVTMKGNASLSGDLSGTTANSKFDLKAIGTALAITQGTTFAKPAGTPLELSLQGIAAQAATLKVTVQNLRVLLASNSLAGSGTYERNGPKDAVNFIAKADRWSVADLAALSPLAAPYHPTGSLSFEARATGTTQSPVTTLKTNGDISMANVKQEFYEGRDLVMKWNLTEVTPDLSRVSGTASMKQGPGKILNVEKLAASSRFGKIALSPLETLAKLQQKGVLREVNLPSLQTVTFDSIVGDYLLKSGVMEVKTFDMKGKDLSVNSRGIVGLSGEQVLAMSVLAKLAPESVGGTLGQIVNDAEGRPTFKFSATGTVANPQVKLDMQETRKKAMEQVGQELMKNQDVQNAVGDLQKSLKGLFR